MFGGKRILSVRCQEKMSEEIRYSVGIKKSYKIFFTVFIVLMSVSAVLSIVLSIGKCETLTDYSAILFVVCFFLFCSCVGICSITKRVEVYNGKVLYCNGLCKREYRLADIYNTKTKEESFYYGHGDGRVTSSWDMVTIFYDKSGKKLFRFGLAYDNVERLK